MIQALTESVESAALSERRLAEAAELLENGIKDGAELLSSRREDRPCMLTRMADLLRQEDGTQTTRMAVAIIANALLFQAALAGNHGVMAPEELLVDNASDLKGKVRAGWQCALKVNYYPIFKLALDLLQAIPAVEAQLFLNTLINLTARLSAMGATTMPSLSGQIFQRMIADRKFLATFYTLPSSAALLAGMAVRRLAPDWTDASEVGDLRIADFACGTGSLLSAAACAVAARHRHVGGDDRTLHPRLMQSVLVGTDIMPAATHLTAAALSSLNPGTPFGSTCIWTLHYGGDGREASIGALELTITEQVRSLFGTGPTLQAGGDGDAESQSEVVAPASCDLVIMNPPFTAPTNHETAEVPIPSFAGFGTTASEQAAMAERLKYIRRRLQLRAKMAETNPQIEAGWKPAGHGNAGLASNFLDLAHAKIRPGGVLALVMPASLTRGASWSGSRALLAEKYKNVTIVGIASHEQTGRAFSADTGMAEVLVVATRCRGGGEWRASDCHQPPPPPRLAA